MPDEDILYADQFKIVDFYGNCVIQRSDGTYKKLPPATMELEKGKSNNKREFIMTNDIYNDITSFFAPPTKHTTKNIIHNTLDRIIISNPCVISYSWLGTKYIVRADHGDIFNPSTGVFFAMLKATVSSKRYSDICRYVEENFDNDGRDKFLLGMLIPIFGVNETLDIWEKANDYDGSHTYTIKIKDILDKNNK